MKIVILDHFSIAMAKIAIFSTDILWESCHEFIFKQLSHSMSVANIAILAVTKKKLSK